eukprot:TRINITY_DN23632_c0_g1_i1.p1 TRINITY_DN23632_c0_g1~~TRINITY_DN23632_c0_g1_i1.p1  ORF type:complete len:129 (-),score=23.89 TRINITY_DN23632_c0_g1_i1:215-553(-)
MCIRDSFRIELLSAALTVPIMFLSYNFIQETKNTVQNEILVNRNLRRLLWVGIPTLNLFLIGLYRRYMNTHKYEEVLKTRYQNEIRRMKAIKKQSEATQNQSPVPEKPTPNK